MALPARQRRGAMRRGEDPWTGMTSLQREMNRMFDDMFGDWGPRAFRDVEQRMAAYQPSIDVSETDDAVKVTAELPGMDEKDVTVNVDEDTLTISGEKKEETRQEGEKTFTQETTYGSFERTIPLTSKIDPDKASASFTRGILKVTLPKMPEEQQSTGRKIEIQTE